MFGLARQSELTAAMEQVAQLQHAVDAYTERSSVESSYTGNPYPTYDGQVEELSEKYEGTASWGCQTAANVIAIRAMFTIAGGVHAVALADGADREMDFVRAFIADNNLDEDVPHDFATEANIEGKFLCKLSLDDSTRRVVVRYIPYTARKYTVATPADDYAKYTSVSYNVDGVDQAVVIPEGQFVYRRFGGRTHKVNQTPPRCAQVLRHMEALDKALVDWRKVNNLFGSPTPVGTCAPNSSEFFGPGSRNAEGKLNWKIGRFLQIPYGADLKLVTMPGDGFESLKEEIITNAEIISGATGVPVHFLGFPHLLSNRSTADNLLELVIASTRKDRDVWRSAYQEMFRKAIAIGNTIPGNAGMDPAKIGAEVPVISDAKMAELKDVWLQLYMAGVVSLETFLAHVPEVTPEEEMDRLRKQETEQAKRMLAAIDEEDAHASQG